MATIHTKHFPEFSRSSPAMPSAIIETLLILVIPAIPIATTAILLILADPTPSSSSLYNSATGMQSIEYAYVGEDAFP